MKKILLVDDDKDLCQNLETVLKSHGYEVAVAYSAVEGLQKALAVKPDAIVLDVLMETDTAGFEFLYQLRSTDKSSRYAAISNTPVILLTAINQITHFRFSLSDKDSYLPKNNGMLTKPVQIDDLLSRLGQL
ncbi:MAG: response regulator transcription factor [Betaproteobacteria bacterium]